LKSFTPGGAQSQHGFYYEIHNRGNLDKVYKDLIKRYGDPSNSSITPPAINTKYDKAKVEFIAHRIIKDLENNLKSGNAPVYISNFGNYLYEDTTGASKYSTDTLKNADKFKKQATALSITNGDKKAEVLHKNFVQDATFNPTQFQTDAKPNGVYDGNINVIKYLSDSRENASKDVLPDMEQFVKDMAGHGITDRDESELIWSLLNYVRERVVGNKNKKSKYSATPDELNGIVKEILDPLRSGNYITMMDSQTRKPITADAGVRGATSAIGRLAGAALGLAGKGAAGMRSQFGGYATSK